MSESCPHCGRAYRIPQKRLTDGEVARLPTGNQNTDALTVIQWQAVKGAAAYYGVEDWIAKADGTLTVDENKELMRKEGTQNGGQTMKEHAGREKLKARTNGDIHP